MKRLTPQRCQPFTINWDNCAVSSEMKEVEIAMFGAATVAGPVP